MRLVGFCVMPNHFHAVLWPHNDGDMGTWMQCLLTSHVRGYRKRRRDSGHVWQGRYKAFPIAEDEHLLTVLRYVERKSHQDESFQRDPQTEAWSTEVVDKIFAEMTQDHAIPDEAQG
jgi:putative transposase